MNQEGEMNYYEEPPDIVNDIKVRIVDCDRCRFTIDMNLHSVLRTRPNTKAAVYKNVHDGTKKLLTEIYQSNPVGMCLTVASKNGYIISKSIPTIDGGEWMLDENMG